jgi:hypothetical protein
MHRTMARRPAKKLDDASTCAGAISRRYRDAAGSGIGDQMESADEFIAILGFDKSVQQRPKHCDGEMRHFVQFEKGRYLHLKMI